MNDLQKYYDAMPKSVAQTVNSRWNRTLNGNISMQNCSYSQLKKVGRYINNNVPMQDRDAFVKTYVSNSVSDFWNKYRKSQTYAYRWKQKGVSLISWQGAFLFAGFLYLIYLSGVVLKELTNDAKESFAIWNEERKEKI